MTTTVEVKRCRHCSTPSGTECPAYCPFRIGTLAAMRDWLRGYCYAWDKPLVMLPFGVDTDSPYFLGWEVGLGELGDLMYEVEYNREQRFKM